MQKALAEFNGVGRRFQSYGEIALPATAAAFTLVDDYGHHPVEMAATLEAARGAFPGRRLVLAFQPHRYTRTRDCSRISCRCCRRSTCCCWPRCMPAGEAPIVAADGRSLARAVRVAGKVEPLFVEDIAAMPEAIRRHGARRRRRDHHGRRLDRRRAGEAGGIGRQANEPRST